MRALRTWSLPLAVFVWSSHAAATCPRPTSEGGYAGIGYGESQVRSVEGDHVRVHYTTEGEHAVTADATTANGDAEGAEAARDVAEHALSAMEMRGWPRPPSDVTSWCDGDGDPRYDVYLLHFAGSDGHTVGESCFVNTAGVGHDCTSFVRLARDLERRYGDLQRGLHTVLVHELVHASQYAITDAAPPFWAEGTAQWLTAQLDESLGDLEAFLPTYFASPERPLDAQGAGSMGTWQYATAIWPQFLGERFSPDVVLQTQQELAKLAASDSVFVALERVLPRHGSTLGDAFAEFARWNLATGTRTDAAGYAHAATYPEVPLRALEADDDQQLAEGVLTSFGSMYFAFNAQHPVQLRWLDGDPERVSAAVVPLADSGHARLDAASVLDLQDKPLEAGDYVLVVSSRTASKRDNPFSFGVSPLPPTIPPPGTDEPPAANEPPSASPELASGGCHTQGTTDPMNRLSALLPLLAALALIGCRRSNSTEAHADSNPAHSGSAQRIVSVGSAVTETVYALGRGAQVVAVDTSSVYPEAATQLPQVGYQRALSAEGVLALSPSLVLLPPEAGPPGVLEQLKNSGTRIEIVDVAANEQGTFERTRRIAGLLGVDPAPLTQQIEHDLTAARTEAKARGTSPKVLVLYARGPGTVQAFGERTAAAQLLELASARNAAAGFEGSRPISAEAIVSWAPDFVLVPSRGLASLGGVDGVANLPGIAETPAGRERHIVGVDDVLLLAFGPRVGQAVTQVDRALRGLAIEQAPAPAYAPPSAVSGASSKAAAKP